MNSPFDEAKYQALLKGLEISELMLSDVLEDNEKMRIDSLYFSKEPTRVEKLIENMKCGFTTFGECTSVFKKGIFDVKAENYTEEGIPFVRISNLKKGLIDDSQIVYLPQEIHDTESQTALQLGDMVLSKTAVPAASFVNLQECNVSQDTIAVQLAPEWKPKLSTAYITAFLNSRYGLELMWRQFQGNVQLHLSLSDGEKIKIPLLSKPFQEAIHQAFLKSFEVADNSATLYSQAETLLLRALDLENWSAPVTNNYTVKSGLVWDAARLDADHFHPQYQEMLDHAILHAKRCRLVSDFAIQCGRGTQPIYDGEGTLAVVNSKHILENGLDYDNFERTDAAMWDAKEFIDSRIQRGDVLTYTTGANIGRTAVYLEDERALASNHVNLTQIEGENSIYVAVVLNSMIGRMQTRRACTGSAQVELYPSDIRQFIVPFVAPEIESEIVRCVEQSHHARRRAKALLERATRAVEVAIETDEAAGLSILEEGDGS